MCRAMNVTTRIPATHAIVALMLTACVLLLGACASTSSQPQAPQPPQAAPSEDEVYHLALHWSRNSAERRAILEQTFTFATERLEQFAQGREPGTWGVSADADETLIDNSQFEVEIRQRGESYNSENWNEWVHRREARALPGAAAFTERVQELGGVVVVVTNRRDHQCEATAQNIEKVGIVYDVVLCRVDDGEKEGRWDAMTEGTAAQWPGAQLYQGVDPGQVTLLMWLGDNIGDFPDQDQAIRHQDGVLSEFGYRYFVLPNPVYGSWEENPKQ